MAARKKSNKKKPTKKKLAQKKPAAKSKKTAKKKSASKAKATSKKTTKAKKVSIKKVVRKKKAIKEAKPIGRTVSRGPSFAGPAEAPAVLVQPLTFNARFELGVAQVHIKQFRDDITPVETKTILVTGSATFKDVRPFDRLAIDGTVTGSATITTDRTTSPASDPASPRKFKDENFVDNLLVLK